MCELIDRGGLPTDLPVEKQIVLYPAELTSCDDDWSVWLWIDDAGRIAAVNLLVPESEGTWTVHLPSGEETTIYEASQRYLAEGVPTIVIAGKEYGSGSSRDWAAKGPKLLGVRAVIAESYERIHRSNLLMMGVLPLQFLDGDTPASLGLTGRETFAVEGIENGEAREVTVRADDTAFTARVRLDTPREREYLRHGGILPYVLRRLRAS